MEEQEEEETGIRGKERLIENERPAHPGTAVPREWKPPAAAQIGH